MNTDSEDFRAPSDARPRTISNASQQSQQSSKQIFPPASSDSGLFTCSSNTSDCSLQLDSDTDCSLQRIKSTGFQNYGLQFALQDVQKLRSELERLTKSEQWYKQELKQQKSTRLVDLERIYTQERKFMQENQRLQKECVRMYEKCNELERELEKQYQVSHQYFSPCVDDEVLHEENALEFEKEQNLTLIRDQQELISVLRKQKRNLLDDLRSLTEEKDGKVIELQRLLTGLEYDNKLITKKCSQFAKERLNLENNLQESENKISTVLQEKMDLQKSIVDLKEQLEIQKNLLKFKESEVEHIQQHYTHKIQHEQDLDQVHELSMKYQEEINAKTLDIINLKSRLQEMQDELEDMKNIQQQNELQQRQIDELNFSLKAHHIEMQELKTSDQDKKRQLNELHISIDELIKDKEILYKTTVEQQNDIFRAKQALKHAQEQQRNAQELYKKTQFQLELLEVEQSKAKFQNDSDRQEINELRKKLKDYLDQTAHLSNKVQYLESELQKVLEENVQLKQDEEQMKKFIKDIKESGNENVYQQRLYPKLLQEEELDSNINHLLPMHSCQRNPVLDKTLDDPDYFKLQQQCEILQQRLDFIKENKIYFENQLKTKSFQENSKEFSINFKTAESLEQDPDILDLFLEGNKLQENFNKLNAFLEEKHHLLSHINIVQNSNDGINKLVTENEALKRKLCDTEKEALALQIKQELYEKTQKYTQIKENLQNCIAKVANLQIRFLKNDAKLYKLERKLRATEEVDARLRELQLENIKLKKNLSKEQAVKAELSEKLTQECKKLKDLEQSLEEIKTNHRPTKNQATQCVSNESNMEENPEVKELKETVLQLQKQQRHILEQEAYKKEERLQFLHQMMSLQSNKIQNLQHHQKDWEDILTSMNNAHVLEEKTRKELELKRLELEELNQVFAEQNEELRKLEEFTALLDTTRQQEKEQLKLTFQKEINVMKQTLQNSQKELEQQKLINEQLEKQNDRFKQGINENFAIEVAGYKNEIKELKCRVSELIQEKEELIDHFRELELQTKDLKDKKREAILMPDFSLMKTTDILSQNSVENLEMLKQNISEDHLRILTKVLEAEYRRKMLRYDEHIHTLLSNLKCLKKALKVSEQKTAMLSEEQLKNREDLKDMQDTKRSFEEMRLKYEQSQNTIQELKNSLAVERRKFELSDLGKYSQNNGSTYEVSNLIDDYKKLIQQSATATKRPPTSAILDLIQRSEQCVPNLQKLESNVEVLRSELQNFLISYSHKIPDSSLIATASLSVPPSLMDELRAASQGF